MECGLPGCVASLPLMTHLFTAHSGNSVFIVSLVNSLKWPCLSCITATFSDA